MPFKAERVCVYAYVYGFQTVFYGIDIKHASRTPIFF